MSKVVLGFSGGVDSAVSAVLLKQAGYEVHGVYLDNTGEKELKEARTSAERMGIELTVVDVHGELEEKVCTAFCESYLRGETPNPCILCNPQLKFRNLLQEADRLGADFIATGHYARAEGGAIYKGMPSNDQSYMLCRLTKEQARRLILPLGGFEKTQVRAMAEDFGLPVAHKADSMEICFIPDNDYAGWLDRRGGTPPPGNFVDSEGKILGTHKGIHHYTLGQRRGLGVSADRPLYVLGKNADSNTVVLGDERELYSTQVWAEDFNWVSLAPISLPMEVTAKTRYSQNEAAATLYPEEEGRVRVVFREAQRAVTAGQALVVYRGEAVVGGGTICDFA